MNLQDLANMLGKRNQTAAPMNGGLENIQVAQGSLQGAAANAGDIMKDRNEYRDYVIDFQGTAEQPEPLQFEPWRAMKYGIGATANPYKTR
jgi:hypothetical protein